MDGTGKLVVDALYFFLHFPIIYVLYYLNSVYMLEYLYSLCSSHTNHAALLRVGSCRPSILFQVTPIQQTNKTISDLRE